MATLYLYWYRKYLRCSSVHYCWHKQAMSRTTNAMLASWIAFSHERIQSRWHNFYLLCNSNFYTYNSTLLRGWFIPLNFEQWQTFFSFYIAPFSVQPFDGPARPLFHVYHRGPKKRKIQFIRYAFQYFAHVVLKTFIIS
jgi:hypothetical protein